MFGKKNELIADPRLDRDSQGFFLRTAKSSGQGSGGEGFCANLQKLTAGESRHAHTGLARDGGLMHRMGIIGLYTHRTLRLYSLILQPMLLTPRLPNDSYLVESRANT